MTLEEVASLLCKGGPVPDWVMAQLRRTAQAVGSPHKGTPDDGSIDRLLLESALHLKNLLKVHYGAADMFDAEYPDGLDQVWDGLEELIPFLAEQVAQPRRKGGPTPDARRHLCAGVCAVIWEELYGTNQPGSERLWEACEAYWVACGQPETSSVERQRLRNWERYLLELSAP